MARNKIGAYEKALVGVFCEDFRFSIPGYQRPYSWTPEHAGALFDDLLNAMEEGDPSGASPYFMGSIVLIKGAGQEADVVDGQQRLTTLTILFSVLRDRMEGKDRRQAHSFVAQEGNKFKGVPDAYRLKLGHGDAKFFEEKIQTEGATESLPGTKGLELSDSRMNILENAHCLAERVKNMDSGKRSDLLSFMVQRCFLVVVEASDQDSAYRVFSVLNDRGLNLSPTDILKAAIIGAIEKSKRETYTEIWEEIEENLGRDRFRDLFAHIRMIHRRTKLDGTLQAEFRKYVIPELDQNLPQRPLHQAATKFMDQTLGPMSSAYLQIVNQDFAGGGVYTESIDRSLRHLALLDNFDWQPSTILFLSKFSEKPELVDGFLSDLDALAYWMFICRVPVGKRISRYADIIGKIDSGGDVFEGGSPIYLSNDEKTKVLDQLDGPVYEISQIRRAVLLRLDEALSDGAANYDHRTVTIEHVLPQKPAKEWMALFPDEDERSDWTHRLANLVLLSKKKNSEAQNYPFEKKKKKYFVSKDGTTTFALTSQVLATDSWTPAHLETRQQELLKKCEEIWNLAPAP